MNHLKSIPTTRRGNYQFKVSIFKDSNILVIGNHLIDDNKFIIQHFHNEMDAVIFIEYLVEKDIYG
jgi:hypothetical protein